MCRYCKNAPPGRGDCERVILYHGGYYRDRGLERFIESEILTIWNDCGAG